MADVERERLIAHRYKPEVTDRRVPKNRQEDRDHGRWDATPRHHDRWWTKSSRHPSVVIVQRKRRFMVWMETGSQCDPPVQRVPVFLVDFGIADPP